MRDDAWGQPFEVNQATAQQYRFSQKELDPDFLAFNVNNRRVHFPFRDLGPFRGAFIQIDPLAFGRGIDKLATLCLYVYGKSRPNLNLDPEGLVCCVLDFTLSTSGLVKGRTWAAEMHNLPLFRNGEVGQIGPREIDYVHPKAGQGKGTDIAFGFDFWFHLTEHSNPDDCKIERFLRSGERGYVTTGGVKSVQKPIPPHADGPALAQSIKVYDKSVVIYDAPGNIASQGKPPTPIGLSKYWYDAVFEFVITDKANQARQGKAEFRFNHTFEKEAGHDIMLQFNKKTPTPECKQCERPPKK